MIPFERDIFVDMIIEKMNKEKQQTTNSVPLDAML
jgi:hypothetical protein